MSVPRPFRRLLVANRAEIAVRIIRAAAALGVESVAVAPDDDASCRHVRLADRQAVLPGRGTSAYLDIEALIDAARSNACDAVHPGYGFCAENPELAQACVDAGLVFVGPPAETLEQLGDKTTALRLAARVRTVQ